MKDPGSARHLLAALLWLLLSGVPGLAEGQKIVPGTGARNSRGPGRVHRSLSLTVLSTKYHNPFLREPDVLGYGSDDVPSGQTIPTVGGRLSWLATQGRGGLEFGVAYWSVRLDDFTHVLVNGESVSYSDASVTLIQADLIGLGAPLRGFPAYVYGVLGFGLRRRSYTITGSPFSEVNGPRRRKEFQSSYGLGVRLSPIRQVSVVGELRWVPGAEGAIQVPFGGCNVYVSRRGPVEPVGAVTAHLDGMDLPACERTRIVSHLVSIGVAIAVP